MNQYEIMVLLKPDIGGDATEKLLEQVRKLITSQGGEIFFEDLWGLRDIAYTIDKYDTGYYAIFNFKIDTEKADLKEIDTTCRLENDMLRHIIIKLPAAHAPMSYEDPEAIEDPVWDSISTPPEEESEQKKPAKSSTTKKTTAKKAEKEKPVEKEESQKEEKKPATKKTKKKDEEKSESSLEDVDAKLQSIIENPDLNF